jgi:glycerol-3-phosphate O-acyltransferase
VYWLDLLYREFFVNRGEVLAAHFTAFVDHFERRGWIVREGDVLRATAEGESHFRFLAEQTRASFESYYAAFSAVLNQELPASRKEFVKAARQAFDRASLLGIVDLPEAANTVSFGNAIDLMLQRGILTRAPAEAGAAGKGEAKLVRGPAFAELRSDQELLAAALGDR